MRHKEVTIRDRDVAVREITAGEALGWYEALVARAETDTAGRFYVDMMFANGAPISIISIMTGMSERELHQFTESELSDLAAACKEVSPSFFAVREAVLTLGQVIQQSESRDSAKASSPSS